MTSGSSHAATSPKNLSRPCWLETITHRRRSRRCPPSAPPEEPTSSNRRSWRYTTKRDLTREWPGWRKHGRGSRAGLFTLRGSDPPCGVNKAITVGVGSPGSREDEHGEQASLPPGKAQMKDKGTGRRAHLRLSGLRENERQAATVADGRLRGPVAAW